MSETTVVIILLCGLIAGLLTGIPVAWTIGAVAMAGAIVFWGPQSIVAMVSAAHATMGNWVLIAAPLFMLMATILNKAGTIERLYGAIHKWSGPLRGGLAVATVFACTVFAACTGITAGAVVAMGLIALPQMLRYRYDKYLGLGSVLAGGTLGQLIPPSVMMIFYGLVTGVSVGKMFAGGFATGAILSALYVSYILVRSALQKDLCPSLPPQERASWGEKVALLRELILPISLIVLVLGSIFSGAATPTEAAAVGVAGAFVCAAVSHKLSWDLLRESALETIKLAGMLSWIVVACTAFSYTFMAVGGRELVQSLLLAMPGGRWGVVIVSMGLLLIMGMLIDVTAMVLIAAPIFSPVIVQLGFDPIWFGVLFMVNLQIAYISPPFGYSLFYLASVAPKGITLTDVYKSSLPFIGMQLIGLTIFIVFPVTVMWLPNLLVS